MDRTPPRSRSRIQFAIRNPKSEIAVAVPSLGLIRTSFHPVQPVQSAAAFAISLEKSGGSMKPEGQIIFIGK